MQIILTIFGYLQFGDFALLRNLTFPIHRRQHTHFRRLKPSWKTFTKFLNTNKQKQTEITILYIYYIVLIIRIGPKDIS